MLVSMKKVEAGAMKRVQLGNLEDVSPAVKVCSEGLRPASASLFELVFHPN